MLNLGCLNEIHASLLLSNQGTYCCHLVGSSRAAEHRVDPKGCLVKYSIHCKGTRVSTKSYKNGNVNSLQGWLTLVGKIQSMFCKVWSNNYRYQGNKATGGC